MHGSARKHYAAELAEGNRRAARPRTCPKCGADVITGDDHDEVAYVATVDPEPLDAAGEMLAIFDGLPTFDLVPQRGKGATAGAKELWWRHDFIVDAGRRFRGATVHALHRCQKGTLF